MTFIPTTATAVEKLNRAAKTRRNATGTTLAVALDAVAVEASYHSWKHVTECAAQTGRGAFSPMAKPAQRCFLPPSARPLIVLVHRVGAPRLDRVHSLGELRVSLGGAEPVIIRDACGCYRNLNRDCVCQLDPFATSKRANVYVDIGDKYDMHDFLFETTSKYIEHPGWQIRAKLGLATSDDYPNEYLDFGSNDDRSDSLNPNSAKHATSRDNHSDQLNPNNWRFRG